VKNLVSGLCLFKRNVYAEEEEEPKGGARKIRHKVGLNKLNSVYP
jgi:hypothetical protein